MRAAARWFFALGLFHPLGTLGVLFQLCDVEKWEQLYSSLHGAYPKVIKSKDLCHCGLVKYQALMGKLLVLSEDVGGSGNDLEGSGAEDWSDQGEITAMKDGTGSKDQTSGLKHWPSIDFQSEVIVVGKSKSFLENQDVTNGLIAGGVTGAILAALLSALLIYTWKSKHGGGFILGKLVHREEAGV